MLLQTLPLHKYITIFSAFSYERLSSAVNALSGKHRHDVSSGRLPSHSFVSLITRSCYATSHLR
jgi:hypothetical protein